MLIWAQASKGQHLENASYANNATPRTWDSKKDPPKDSDPLSAPKRQVVLWCSRQVVDLCANYAMVCVPLSGTKHTLLGRSNKHTHPVSSRRNIKHAWWPFRPSNKWSSVIMGYMAVQRAITICVPVATTNMDSSQRQESYGLHQHSSGKGIGIAGLTKSSANPNCNTPFSNS